MPTPAARILPYLPYLRRYARALTGSQDRGDEYVRACVEAILAEPELIPVGENVRLQLFASFHAVWTVLGADLAEAEAAADHAGDAGLADFPGSAGLAVKRTLTVLPPKERQVLLLVSLEGFSFEETSYILGLEEGQVRDLLDRARSDIRLPGLTEVLIIEDDPIIAMGMSAIVEEMGYRVVGTAARQGEAVEMARRFEPNLVLADIQLADGGNGIASVQQILRGTNVPVIFVTGHPELLLTGERLEPAFVVTKPFQPQALKDAISQALSFQPPLPQQLVQNQH